MTLGRLLLIKIWMLFRACLMEVVLSKSWFCHDSSGEPRAFISIQTLADLHSFLRLDLHLARCCSSDPYLDLQCLDPTFEDPAYHGP